MASEPRHCRIPLTFSTILEDGVFLAVGVVKRRTLLIDLGNVATAVIADRRFNTGHLAFLYVLP